MGITVLPKTPWGRWAVGTAIAAIVVSLLNILLGKALNVLEFKSGSIELRIIFVALGISGIGSLLTGFISIIKSKERSILVLLALVVGLFYLGIIVSVIAEAQW